jgi:hypothetical protein
MQFNQIYDVHKNLVQVLKEDSAQIKFYYFSTLYKNTFVQNREK